MGFSAAGSRFTQGWAVRGFSLLRSSAWAEARSGCEGAPARAVSAFPSAATSSSASCPDSAAIVMGGYFRPEFGPYYNPYPANGRLATRYDLIALTRRNPPPVAIWLETSHADPVSYTSSAAFLKATKPPLASTVADVHNHA